MLYPWPEVGSEAVAVRWPKNLGILVIVGVFAAISAVLIPGLLYFYVNDRFPSDFGTGQFVFLFAMVSLFGLAAIGGFISIVKNYQNPFIRFLATRDGIYLNITFKMKEAFFVPWTAVTKIEKTQVKRSMGSGGTMIVDALSVFLDPSANIELPKVMRGLEGGKSTGTPLNFTSDTLDADLDKLIAKIQAFKI